MLDGDLASEHGDLASEHGDLASEHGDLVSEQKRDLGDNGAWLLLKTT